jgi:hypothetical protein
MLVWVWQVAGGGLDGGAVISGLIDSMCRNDVHCAACKYNAQAEAETVSKLSYETTRFIETVGSRLQSPGATTEHSSAVRCQWLSNHVCVKVYTVPYSIRVNER